MEPIDEVLDAWRAHPDREPCLVAIRDEPAKAPRFADLDPPPSEGLRTALAAVGVERLYRHQVEAITRLREGRHVVLVAGTATGKSLAYQLPVVERLLAEERATALFLYPTKALGRDQLGTLHRLGAGEIIAAVYDGDTVRADRRWIRRHARVVLSNPDMLHVGILPNHPNWARFLAGLRFVVVDELHTLRGAFGIHVALVLRRLRRLAGRLGAEPTFALTSATVGNPGELGAALVGEPVDVVHGDDAARGPRTFVVWNPELEDPDAGTRAGPLGEATAAFTDLVRAGVRTIWFARSRRSTEVGYRLARDRLPDDLADRVAPYRAGYRPEERREAERRLASGELLGVVSTNALELGIDVGGLDAAVLTTFPGTIASFRQQAGRAGRGERRSLCVLVCGHDALDQWYAAHPDDLFSRNPEAVVVNPANPTIVAAHLACAAHEAALVPDDRRFFGEGFEELVTDLVAEGRLDVRHGRVFWPEGRSPAPEIDLRAAGRAYVVVDGAELLGTVDEGRAFTQCHPGAVYLHRGEAYVVEELDWRRGEVRVRREEVPWWTEAKVEREVTVLRVEEETDLGDMLVGHGTVEVESLVVAYRRRAVPGGEVLDTVPLDLPARRLVTQGVWYRVPPLLLTAADLDGHRVPGALHAVEHAAIGMLPLFAVCDRWDVGGVSSPWLGALDGPGFVIHDGHPGGTGVAPLAYEIAAEHLGAVAELLRSCPCRAGCPSCVQSPKCGNFNEPLDKAGALALLEAAFPPRRSPGR